MVLSDLARAGEKILTVQSFSTIVYCMKAVLLAQIIPREVTKLAAASSQLFERFLVFVPSARPFPLGVGLGVFHGIFISRRNRYRHHKPPIQEMTHMT